MNIKHSPTQACGYKAEKKACHYLKCQGFKLLAKNFKTRLGEVDLIMANDTTLIFVEVRQRKMENPIHSVESIDHRKQRRIMRTALVYLQKHPSFKALRFDVVAIQTTSEGEEIIWIKDAFQVQ